MNPNRLLVMDDQPDICELIAAVGQACGFDTRVAQQVDQFWSEYRELDPTVIALDLQMPETDGIEVLRLLAAQGCRAGIAIVSGQDHRILAAANRLGAERGLRMLGVISKPMMLEDLEALLDEAKGDRSEISARSLSEALAEKQLVVYYQPKARWTNGRWHIEGAEALVRWRHPRIGLIMPDRFIPLAVQAGLIGPLTTQVLTTAVAQIKRWRDSGFSLSVAVNLAPQLLSDLSLPDKLMRLTAENGISPSALTLEITESGAMADVSLTTDILTRFRLKGFNLSIDDFGTGYSSLVQLYRMPFNELKIDKSFVMEMLREEEVRGIVRLLVELARQLELSVCAEGVENRETLDLLAALGCHKAQGYLFGKPQPAAEMEAVFKLWND